ncbi:MAG: NADH-quinone oxidoreductase subunit C [Acidilobaceae archaeon]|nr:NADH-quinone oxidoreductase subunit C [Acidilobaceae archaeon]
MQVVEALSLQALAEVIKERLGTLAKEVRIAKGHVEIVTEGGRLTEAARALKEMGFDHVKSVTAVDYPKEGKIRVTYHVSSYLKEDLSKYIVGLSVDVPRDNPIVETLVPLWNSAEFFEREVFEFFGVHFKGHPDLRPLLLIPELAEKRVLRKDFVVREEGIYEGVPHEYK